MVEGLARRAHEARQSAQTLNLSRVNLVRSLERRLERLLEGVVGRAFSRRLHHTEIAGRLAREADFARFDHAAGPATANSFTLTFNPGDLTTDPGELEAILSDEMASYAADQGLRVEGPTTVSIETSDQVLPGQMTCHVEVVPGPLVTWARLVSDSETLPIGRNRVLIGRAPEMDVVIAADDVSRRHASIWRQGGASFVTDLASSNGTFVDGERVGNVPTILEHGSTIRISEHAFRFLTRDA